MPDFIIDNHTSKWHSCLKMHFRENGVTALTYRTTFNNLADPGDLEIPETGETSIIWAIGKLSEVSHRYASSRFIPFQPSLCRVLNCSICISWSSLKMV